MSQFPSYGDASSRVPTRDEIFEIARTDPFVHGALALYDVGALSWEQALMVAVRALSALRGELLREVETRLLNNLRDSRRQLKNQPRTPEH